MLPTSLTIKLAFNFWDDDLGLRSSFFTVSLVAHAFHWHVLWEDCTYFFLLSGRLMPALLSIASQYVPLAKSLSHIAVAVANRPLQGIAQCLTLHYEYLCWVKVMVQGFFFFLRSGRN